MTSEEIIERLRTMKAALIFAADATPESQEMAAWASEAINGAISALKGPTREQVEKMRGEWIDSDGKKVPVDKYGQPFGWAKCSACGEYLTASEKYPCKGLFCPACGSPMTDKAVDMVMERLEEMHADRDT